MAQGDGDGHEDIRIIDGARCLRDVNIDEVGIGGIGTDFDVAGLYIEVQCVDSGLVKFDIVGQNDGFNIVGLQDDTGRNQVFACRRFSDCIDGQCNAFANVQCFILGL